MDYKVFGCKTNRYFAEKWLAHPHLEWKEGYFIASCVVTDKAKAKWVKHALRKLPTLKSNEKLYLSGCGNIQDGVVDPRFYEVYEELSEYQERIEILPEDPDDFSVTPEEKKSILQTKIRSLKAIKGKHIFTRKFLVIQTGCDNFCTFCLTVQARGRHKWRPMDEIIAEVQTFVEGGGKEVVLTGINLWAWWAPSSNDYPLSKFVELVEAIVEDTTIERIRISSLGVEFCTDRLIELFANPRIIAYPHLSIQSGSTPILEKMGRHYDGVFLRSVLEKLWSIKREDGIGLNIGADLIVGFPGETEEDFLLTLELVKKYGVTQLHAFPFSAHIDHYSVPAGRFPDQVPNHIIQRRLKTLLETGKTSQQVFTERHIGKELRVLVEKFSWMTFSGWSENYLACDETNFIPFPWQKIARGEVVQGLYQGYAKIIYNDNE